MYILVNGSGNKITINHTGDSSDAVENSDFIMEANRLIEEIYYTKPKMRDTALNFLRTATAEEGKKQCR